MKSKILNALLIFTSLLGYLEWGQDQHMFLLEGEWDMIKKLFTDPGSVIHPFIFLPMLGQLLLFYTLFQIKPSRWLSLTGIIGIAILLLFMLFVGLLSINFWIVLSVLPFILFSIFVLFYRPKIAKQ